MKKRIGTKLIIILILLLAYAKYHVGHSYKGDGRFIDNGCTAATDRYVLDLGEIDLASNQKYTYKMTNLPTEEMTIGFSIEGFKNIQNQDNAVYFTRPVNALVRIILTNSKGNLVVNEMSYLSQWAWSGRASNYRESFVYLRGEEVKRKLSKGSDVVANDRIEVKPDGGWGTYFTPTSLTAYHLTIEIIEPAKNAKDYKAIVRLLGGGWK
jgi:hypothetical protein